jgi:hypothetical protein
MAKKPVTFEEVLTFERASTATYFDSDGVLQTAAIDEPRRNHDPVTGEALGLMREPSKTNLLAYSEDFAAAYWGDINSSVEPNTTIAPDGIMTANKLSSTNSTAGTSAIVKSSVASVLVGEKITLSIFAKAGAEDFFVLSVIKTGGVFIRGANAEIDLSTNTINLDSGSEFEAIDGGIIDVGDGWVRCFVVAESKIDDDVQIWVRLSGVTSPDFIYIWGAQAEKGGSLSSYIPTSGSPVTRAADIITTRGDI